MATLQTLPVELLDLIFKRLSLSDPYSLQNLALSSSRLHHVALGLQPTFTHLVETRFGSLLGDALLAIRSRGRDLFHHKQEATRIIEMYSDKVELQQSGSLGETFRLLIFHNQLQFLVEDHAKIAPRPMVRVDEMLRFVPLPKLSPIERYRFLRALCRIQIYRNVFTPPETSLEEYQTEKKEFGVTSEDDLDETYKRAYRMFFKARPSWENAEIGSVLWYMQQRDVSFYEEIYNDMLDMMVKHESKWIEEHDFPSFSQDVREVYDKFRHLDKEYKANELVQRGFFNLFNHRIDVMKKYQPESRSGLDKTFESVEDVILVYDSMIHAKVVSNAAVQSLLPVDVGGLHGSMLALADKYESKDVGQFKSLPEDVRPSLAGIQSLDVLRHIQASFDSTYPTEALAAMGPDFLYRAIHADPLTRRHMIMAHATGFQKTSLQDGLMNIDLVSVPHPDNLQTVGDFQDLWQTLSATEQPNMAWKELHIHGERDEKLVEVLQHVDDYPPRWKFSYALWDDDTLDRWGTDIWVN